MLELIGEKADGLRMLRLFSVELGEVTAISLAGLPS